MASANVSSSTARAVGTVLGVIHQSLAHAGGPVQQHLSWPTTRAEDTVARIARLIGAIQDRSDLSDFDRWAVDALTERSTALEHNAHLRPEPFGLVVSAHIHGDFNPMNVLFHHGSDEPVAILDWERSGLGSPSTELIRTAVLWLADPDTGSIDLSHLDAMMCGYRTKAHVPASDVADALHRFWWDKINDLWLFTRYYHEGRRNAESAARSQVRWVTWLSAHLQAVDITLARAFDQRDPMPAPGRVRLLMW